MLGSFALWKTLAILLAAVLPVKATTQSGESIEGSLGAVTATSLAIDIDGRPREILMQDLQTVSPANVQEQTGPTYLVTLSGGSKIAAETVSLVDSGLSIQPRQQDPLSVPVRQVKAIRFRASGATTDAQWLGLLQKESRGDVMVIRRPGDKLDPASGIIESIADGKVSFNLEGDTVAAPLDRLEGVVFGSTAEAADDAPVRITDVYGSTWLAESLVPSDAGQPIAMKLSSGQIHHLPLEQIKSIRFSSGLSMLATEKPADVKTDTYFQTNIDGGLVNAFFGPAAQDGNDLQMHGGSKIEYRVADGFVMLVGAVRRASEVKRASEMSVRILLDGKKVWEESLPDVQPRGFEIPLKQARRLTIEVDSRDDGNLGDTVQIIRPRLLK